MGHTLEKPPLTASLCLSLFTADSHTGKKPFYPVGHAVIPSEPPFLSNESRSERVFLFCGSRSQPIFLSQVSRSDPPCLLKHCPMSGLPVTLGDC